MKQKDLSADDWREFAIKHDLSIKEFEVELYSICAATMLTRMESIGAKKMTLTFNDIGVELICTNKDGFVNDIDEGEVLQ